MSESGEAFEEDGFEIESDAIEESDSIAEKELNESTESGDSEEKQPSGWIDFEALEQKAGKEHAEAIRRRVGEDFRHKKESESKIKQLQRELQEIKNKEFDRSKPVIVEPPGQDEWVDDPDSAAEKQQEWLKSSRDAEAWDREKQRIKDDQDRIQRETAQEIDRAYFERAKNANVDKAKLEYANRVVADSLSKSNVGSDVASFLLGHNYGPQLVASLAADPDAMMDIASLSMVEAVVKLDRMSDQFKRKTKSSAPPPDDPIKSSGSIQKDDDLKGFTFE